MLAGLAPVMLALSPRALFSILDPVVGMVLWPRSLCGHVLAVADGFSTEPEFSRVVDGMPGEVARDALAGLPAKAQPLRADLGLLATLYARLSGASAVRLRLEHMADEGQRDLHVDAAALHLVCTYNGRGIEWQDAVGTIRRMPAGHVGVFKGTAWPDPGPRILWRSPSVAHLLAVQHGRLVLGIGPVGRS